MYICNCNTSEKSVPSLPCCSLITIVLTKQFENLQWHNKVHSIFLLKCFLQRNLQVSLLASMSWVKGTLDSESWTNVSDMYVLDSGTRIVLDGMSWMPMSRMQMDRTQETLFAIAYCMLLKHCINSKWVSEIMRCFRSMQCCVFRESTAPEVLRQIPWFFMYDCLVMMWNKLKVK